MSYDEFLREGTFDPKVNPIAAQLNAGVRASGVGPVKSQVLGTSDQWVLENTQEVVDALWEQNIALRRAIALLENQISDLRGHAAPASDNLIPVSDEITAAVLDGSKRI